MTENLGAFLADFGVSVTGPSNTSGLGILDSPDQVFGDPVGIISTEYLLTVRTADFPGLKYGDEMTVDSNYFLVREAQKIDDGTFTRVLMSATTAPVTP